MRTSKGNEMISLRDWKEGDAGVIWKETLRVLNKCITLYKSGGSLYKHAVTEM